VLTMVLRTNVDFSIENRKLAFAYRRVLGMEEKDRVKKTVYVESEFIDAFPEHTFSDVVNMGLMFYLLATCMPMDL
jgi:hypothetical protein